MDIKRFTWTEMRWEEPEKSGRRILLLGDSITNGYWNIVRDLAPPDVYVDIYVTSKYVCHPGYRRELEYYLSNGFKYDAVHFNNGLHGGQVDIAEYKEHYENVVKYILTGTGAEVILALSTPTWKNVPTMEYRESNKIILERNEAVRRIAEKYELAVNDLYTTADGLSKLCTDGVHFSPEGYQILGEQVASLCYKETKK